METITALIPALITFQQDMGQGAPPTRDNAKLDYYTDDPYAIQLTVLNVPWSFSRDLLTEALNLAVGGGEVGIGDVRVGRTWESIVLRLQPSQSDAVQAYITLSFAQVRQFITDTYKAVPIGCEKYDVDSWIAQMDAMGDAE